MQKNELKIQPVILCGGNGTRLWPTSRETLPKQFINFFGNKSLFELTLKRTKNLKNAYDPIIVLSKTHKFYVEKIISKIDCKPSLLIEPIPKNTTAAIYLATKTAPKDSVILIMPSDHLMDEKKFVKYINLIKTNFDPNDWVTLGITPSYPSENFGYIEVKPNNVDDKISKFDLLTVKNFIEKPNNKIALQMIKKGNYYWNSGIFLGSQRTILNSIKYFALDIAKACDLVINNIKEQNPSSNIYFDEDKYKNIPSISIDYAIMEKAKNIKMAIFDGKWDDVGNWDALTRHINDYKQKPNIIEINTNNNFIKNNKNQIVACIGTKNLIIINEPDALLVIEKGQSEKVREVVDHLIERKIPQAKSHAYEYRPWGKFINIYEDMYCKVKRIEIDSNKRLSLQYHNFRSEHWLIISGAATVIIDDNTYELTKGMSIDIPKLSHHYVENKSRKKLIIIETQLGSYFGEDDIIRIDDPYKR